MSGTVNPMSAPASRESSQVGSPSISEYQPPPASGTSVSIGWSQDGPPSQQIFYEQTYPTALPPTPYGSQIYPKKQIFCCSPSEALIILGVVEIVLAILCIIENRFYFELHKLGPIVICGVSIISSLLLFLGVGKKLNFLVWQFVVWNWIGLLIITILNIIFDVPSFTLQFKITYVIGVILVILLTIFETHCVYVFVNENSTDQQESGQLHQTNPQKQQSYQGYPATVATGYSPASFGPSGEYGSPNPNYSNNPQYSGTGYAAA